jgi:hypothetical protein
MAGNREQRTEHGVESRFRSWQVLVREVRQALVCDLDLSWLEMTWLTRQRAQQIQFSRPGLIESIILS